MDVDTTEFPYEDAQQILTDAAHSTGHSAEIAETLAQTAWWLENRGMKGVQSLVLYLLMTAKMSRKSRAPQPDGQGGVRVVCPIEAGAFCLSVMQRPSAPASFVLSGGPACPVLMAPLLAHTYAAQDKAVRLTFQDQKIVFSKELICQEGDAMPGFGWIDPTAKNPTIIEVIPNGSHDPAGWVQPYRKRETLDLPTKRLRADNSLELS